MRGILGKCRQNLKFTAWNKESNSWRHGDLNVSTCGVYLVKRGRFLGGSSTAVDSATCASVAVSTALILASSFRIDKITDSGYCVHTRHLLKCPSWAELMHATVPYSINWEPLKKVNVKHVWLKCHVWVEQSWYPSHSCGLQYRPVWLLLLCCLFLLAINFLVFYYFISILKFESPCISIFYKNLNCST